MSSANILNNEAFNNVDPQKLKMLVEMFNEMGSKTAEQKIQVLFAYGMKMKQMGLNFTPNESRIIMESLKENLTTAEKNKLDMMVKMMEMMNAQ